MMCLLGGQLTACLVVCMLISIKTTFRARLLGAFRACAVFVFAAGIIQFLLLTCLDKMDPHSNSPRTGCPHCAFVTTCTFLNVSLFILGLGAGSTYALGVSFLCGVTKRTSCHGPAMHRLGSLALAFLIADFAGFVVAYACVDQTWLFVLSMSKIAATLPVIVLPKFLEDYAELGDFKTQNTDEQKRRLNGGDNGGWRHLYWNKAFGADLGRATALIVFLNLTPMVSQSVTANIFDTLNVETNWVQRYGFASHFFAIVAGFISQALSQWLKWFESPRNRLYMLASLALANGLLAGAVVAWDASPVPTTRHIGILFTVQRVIGAVSTETVLEILPYAFSKATFPFGFSAALTFRSALHFAILAAVKAFDGQLVEQMRVTVFIVLAVFQFVLVMIMLWLRSGIPEDPHEEEELEHEDEERLLNPVIDEHSNQDEHGH
ncbi:hypothetical protein AAVH_09861 [Aphelenchoides avenae]|nr:hypothetical protein AAVH_09861 [Aphelenchus avenae]